MRISRLSWPSASSSRLACSLPARATDFTWIGSGGGAFTTSPLWSPFFPQFGIVGPGGAGDTVNFILGQPASSRYTVTGVAGQNDRLLVGNDSLTLNIPDRPSTVDYAVLNTSLVSPSFTVGLADGDAGDVILTGEGVFETRTSSIGHAAGSRGVVTVNNLQWVGSSLVVGEFGEGTLTIAAGDTVFNINNGFIGFQPGSTGTVAVSGPGSTWTNGGILRVGQAGMARC